MVVGVVCILLDGGFMEIKDRSLGWIIMEKVSHEISMIKNHGFGFS